ncbi:hypothetical protein SAMN05192574_110151 [Mucilaginibacter gossypiicola]|uniref:Uncharacterized protein n=1 Tax=Mucilaginibacter gossypiicola TaxID=551995 RepID=A0A1H8RI27_9SPHI|nr:hypothetical protein [Mucilaginibacter gossypiicola]SEO65673.1 hypothetical protein SAMN05192574_110151 [Mucilaginibacter gossypiicola]
MINKVPVKKLIEFRRLSERRRSTFANSLKTPKMPKSDDSSGGDYWKRSTSGLSNAFKYNDNKLIQEKIDSVSSVYESARKESTKRMYKRNLEILHSYTTFDFSIWRPPTDLRFLTKSKLMLTIKDIPIQVLPHHIFSYEDKGKSSIGGIWFVVWLDGFKPGDLGIYSESLFRYLTLIYSKKYNVDPNYCLTVDASSKDVVSYTQVLKGKIPSLLENTVDTLNKFLI